MASATSGMRRAKVVVPSRTLACAVILSQAALAHGQELDLPERLTAGLQCAFADPARRLALNVESSGASPVELMMALTEIAEDPMTCRAIKDAAAAELTKVNSHETVVKHKAVVVARQRMEDVLREADQRASAMRFVVGPPPPRLTRNRPPVP